MTFLVPKELHTERLILRQFQEQDCLQLHRYYSDEEATKFTVARKFSKGDTWRTMASMIGHWQIKGYGPYAVVERSSQRVLGPIGFWFPNDWPFPEVKWGLAREHWGKGFASEGARAVLLAWQQYIPHTHLISLIHQDNQASINLARALGATLECELDFRGSVFQQYKHQPPGNL
jgi:RimJ/RimL family protein N-acetyltransferase